MKRVFFLFIVALSLTAAGAGEVFATSAAKDWKWSFTEVRDDKGNLLAQNTGSATSPLIVNILPDQYKGLRVYGSFFNKQDLTSSNIDFVSLRTSAEKVGEGDQAFFSSYTLSVNGPWTLDNRLPLPANQNHPPFLFFEAFLKDPNTPPTIGTYRVYSSAIDFYDLSEPLNQFGNHTLYGRQSMNEVQWNVTPEPISWCLFCIGGLALGLFKRRS